VVFGGIDANEGLLGDLWTLDLMRAGSQPESAWRLVDGGTSGPGPRGNSAGLLAPSEVTRSGHDELWVFGGKRLVDVDNPGSSEDTNELWTFDFVDEEWRQENWGQESAPAPRRSLAAARTGSSIIVYGGISDDDILVEHADLWAYDFAADGGGGQWELMHSGVNEGPSPGARSRFAMTTIPSSGQDGDQIFIHGGSRLLEDTLRWELLSDTWVFTPSTGKWKELKWKPALSRMYHCMAYVNGLAWAHGGIANVVVSGMKQHLYTTTRVLAAPVANGTSWLEYLDDALDEPGSRFDHSMQVWRGQLLVYGGRFRTLSDARDTLVLDVGSLASSDLIVAEDDPPAALPMAPFSILHLIFALSVMMCCMCVFLGSVRRQVLDRGDGTGGGAPSFGGLIGQGETHSRGLPAGSLSQFPVEQFAVPKSAPLDLEGETCAICLEAYTDGEALRCMPCGHRFHSPCIDCWLQSRSSCPMCKRDFAPAQEVRAEAPHSNWWSWLSTGRRVDGRQRRRVDVEDDDSAAELTARASRPLQRSSSSSSPPPDVTGMA
jgi:hypothetical protein